MKSILELYQILVSLCQGQKESPQAFLINALDFRQQILFAYSDENYDTVKTTQIYPAKNKQIYSCERRTEYGLEHTSYNM